MGIVSTSYLILHSEHDGDLQHPWIVYRCYHGSEQQDELFRGARADAVGYLASHWDDEPPASTRKIVTKFDPPPIPVRECDWSATFDDYDLGSPIGHGATEQNAIDDLLIEAEA